ncbi:hypothetical protein GDO78_006008 [Eleutherodactylus coqui]|uniref:Centrosomal protein of 290kDa coiled-coil region domain-containing protein n=1 Tax=Eleutherodactylus coqui TaxID=57060 RepID=A0A8J6FPK1_ELECQ|nr:hypothetical protein GDO78_006008 [Eleutherodactylus coqui]
MQMAQLSTGTRDSRFLREEIRQLEEQLGQRARELKDTRKELEKEKEVNERLALRNEETDNENSKLRRENEQLRQDVIDYQRQIDSQRESLMSRGEGQDYKSLISKKNMELVQYLDEIQSLSEANERLEAQNQEMTKNLEESVQEMEKMTDEYSKMKLMVQHSDSAMDQLRREKEHYRLQVMELTEQLKAKNEEDDPVMVAVNLKVEEWKTILASKEEEITEYQHMVHNLREKLKLSELDADKSSVLALQQGLQERDNHIKMLTEQLEQHTKEMESHSLHIEELKQKLQIEKEQRLREAERVAELAENDARQKDKDLIDAIKRMKEYEMGVYGLEEAVAEIKELKTNLKIRDREIETFTTDINKLELKINDILDENEDLRERLGLDPKTVIDLTDFRNVKALKQQQYRAENQVLLKEIERLEEERVELKKQVRKLAQEKGKKSASLGLMADDLFLNQDSLREAKSKQKSLLMVDGMEDIMRKISHLENEVVLLRQSEGANIVFKAVNLPEGMSLSSTNLINSINEYLLHLLEEVKSKENSVVKLEEALEEYKRKFAVMRHQQGLVYKEYQSERESWQVDVKRLKEEVSKLESEKEQDTVQIKEYMNLLETLKMGPDEIKKLLAENSRKMTVLRVNEKSLTRRYTTLLEMEQHLRKENDRLRSDISDMEAAVGERIGYLQRYKDIAAFKVASLQKALDDSIPLLELEAANRQYNDLTAKYRDMLQKDNLLVQRTANLEHSEHENASLKSQITSYIKELEIAKEKLNTLEQAWEHIGALGGNSAMDKATKAITNNEIVSISKKITMLEMKELNERQRSEHSLKMYEHLRITLKQVEERNFELESKFAELTKINLEAQKIEQALRDELADSISKEVSDADRKRIIELEKSEAELSVEVSKLRNLSDIAKAQVSTLVCRQQSREKEVESLRKQVLDFQDQTDEKALIAKLHQQIVALQISESAAVAKLEATTSKLQKMEAYSLRLEQKIDDKEQALYYARLEGTNRAKHLRHTIQTLRRQFSGALPLAQQEKFSKTLMELQTDKLKTVQEMQLAQQQRRNAETHALELDLKLKGLEELIGTLKDARGAQKVTEWHQKMEEMSLQDMKLIRELNQKKEEIKYLSNIISEQERTINNLEEELVQQRKFHEERQMSWDQREVELERQLDMYKQQQHEVLSAARKFEEATGELPDASLPLPHQLDMALRKIKEHVRTILETKAICRTLEQRLKEKEALLWTAEQNVLSRDKVINELRLRLPAVVDREKLMSEFNQKEEDSELRQALKVAHQTIENMQARLNQKEEVLKKYQHLLAKAREEQQETAKKHAEDLKGLHQKLDLHSDASITKFKEAALELMRKPTLQVPSSAHLMRMAEMEQTVAEQDISLSTLSNKLKDVTGELERQKQRHLAKMNEQENSKARLEENSILEAKKHKSEAEELRVRISEMEKEINYLNTELEAQKEANTRAPTATMKNLVERLKSQVAHKEKQQKALSKALLALRAEMTAHAEQQIISAAAQKEEDLNIQQIVDRQTKDLKARIEDLNEQLLKLKETLKSSRARENNLTEDLENLNQEMRGKQKIINKLQKEKDEVDKENEELKKRLKRLMSSAQSKSDLESKHNLIDELQKKVKRLEVELEKKTVEAERKPAHEDKSSKEEIIRWEEGKKWQTKLEGMRSKLRDKEKEVETLTKQLMTLKDLYSKADQEKIVLQKRLKSRGITADQVVGVRAVESEREIEELRKKNIELENEMSYMKTKQALPRDSVVDELHLKNQYLQEKIQVLERQISKENLSRPSTSGVGSEDPFSREMELQKENLKLSAENVELQFQLEQANKDLPRLKDQIANLKEMCDLLKKDKLEAERKLGNVRGSGRSGKTIPELEKTIGLMKRVVERVQRENEELKKAPGVLTSEKLSNLELENEKLKSELEKLQLHVGGQLSMRYEAKTKGMEKVIAENERLRKELKTETEMSEKLRIAKRNLEVVNEKLSTNLEETRSKLNFAESRGPQLEGADSKAWKSVVVSKMYETKMKEMEAELIKRNDSIVDLKKLLKEATERERKTEQTIQHLKDEIDLLKHFPEDAKTDKGLSREFQILRLTNNRLENEKAELVHQLETYKQQSGSDEVLEKDVKYNKLMEQVVDLETHMKTSDLEKLHLKEEIKRLKKELENFDPNFFEEIEDLKYNYNEEVKKNILLEEKLKALSQQFGVHIGLPMH